MVTHKAKIVENDGEYYLSLEMPENAMSIPITKDVPKDVQNVFNQLIVSLKTGVFGFEVEEVDNGDIIYHVAKEYISQLNSELKDIYEEMKGYGLLSEEDDKQ
jgi:hypothetical protein